MKQLSFTILLGIFLLTISVLSTPLRRENDISWSVQTFGCKVTSLQLKKVVKWTVSELKCKVDNCKERPVIIVHPSDKFPSCKDTPAPTICAKTNQNIRILVTNNLTLSEEPLTIHWHGLLMKKNAFADGVPAINQCPIPFGNSYLYDFKTNNEPGTHWYHSHYKPQRMDGLYGLFIINQEDKIDGKDDPYKDYKDIIVLISDWYHEKASVLLKEYEDWPQKTDPSCAGSAAYEPVPYSVLINGKGQGNCDQDKTYPHECVTENCTIPSNFISDTGIVYDLSDRNAKYRFRIINAGALIEYYFSIDDHELQVIEVEGQYVKHVDSRKFLRIPIHVGQRYSVIASPKISPLKNTQFWMRVDSNPECLRYNTPCSEAQKLVKTIRSIVSYSKSTNVPKTKEVNEPMSKCIDLNMSLLEPLDSSKALKESLLDSSKALIKPKIYSMNIYMFTNFSNKVTVGEVINKDPDLKSYTYNDANYNCSENTLNRVYEIHKQFANIKAPEWPSYVWPYQQNLIPLYTRDQVITVNIQNVDRIAHPFHLHGHFFKVIGTTIPNPEKENPNPIKTKYENPISRDTAIVPSKGDLTIQFTTDNPGVWAFHCHIEWHVEVGMMTQFVELPDEIYNLPIPKLPEDVTLPEGVKTWNKLCKTNKGMVCENNYLG